MRDESIEPFTVVESKPRISGSRLGLILRMNGGPVVDFAGNPLGPRRAKVVASLSADVMHAAMDAKLPVLLLFENDDPARPVIVDVVIPASDEPVTEARSADDGPDEGAMESEQAPQVSVSIANILAVRDGCVTVEDGSGTESRARTAIVLRNLKDPVVVLAVPGHLPVVIGQLYKDVLLQPGAADKADISLKGGRVTIEADTELVLKAGGSVLRLDSRGKVSTTGEHIVSRARGTNKVQGGSIHLN
jgi:hypothetical protein